MDNAQPPKGLSRRLGYYYGVLAFGLTFAFFTHLVIFLANAPTRSEPWVSPSVDIGPAAAPFLAGLVDLALVALFGLQHSVMARPWFKRWWMQYVPQGLERATYSIAASLVGFIMLTFWQPIPVVIWDLSGIGESAMWTLFGLGWVILLMAGISFNLSELLGLRQAKAWSEGRTPKPLTLKTSWLYNWMKHPMYVGVLLGFWMTPYMTVGHALMAAGFILYILIAMRYEERDLSRNFGAAYEAWRGGCPHARPRPGRDARVAP